MPGKELYTISVGEHEIQSVVERLIALHAMSLRQSEAGSYTPSEPTAAWCIGETLAACGGYELMWLVFKAFEEREGPACAVWLDRSWHGIDIPGVVRWVGHSA